MVAKYWKRDGRRVKRDGMYCKAEACPPCGLVCNPCEGNAPAQYETVVSQAVADIFGCEVDNFPADEPYCTDLLGLIILDWHRKTDDVCYYRSPELIQAACEYGDETYYYELSLSFNPIMTLYKVLKNNVGADVDLFRWTWLGDANCSAFDLPAVGCTALYNFPFKPNAPHYDTEAYCILVGAESELQATLKARP